VLAISIDSIYCHANWALSLGGIAVPLLSDFQPKGAVADSYGLYLDGPGITDRATVIIDAGGTIRHISSVTPAGKRDINALLAECQKVDAAYEGAVDPIAAAGVGGDAVLYVKSNCGFSKNVLAAVENLHLGDKLTVRNVTEDPAALAALEAAAGKTTAPVLVAGGQVIPESKVIVGHLAERTWGF